MNFEAGVSDAGTTFGNFLFSNREKKIKKFINLNYKMVKKLVYSANTV